MKLLIEYCLSLALLIYLSNLAQFNAYAQIPTPCGDSTEIEVVDDENLPGGDEAVDAAGWGKGSNEEAAKLSCLTNLFEGAATVATPCEACEPCHQGGTASGCQLILSNPPTHPYNPSIGYLCEFVRYVPKCLTWAFELWVGWTGDFCTDTVEDTGYYSCICVLGRDQTITFEAGCTPCVRECPEDPPDEPVGPVTPSGAGGGNGGTQLPPPPSTGE